MAGIPLGMAVKPHAHVLLFEIEGAVVGGNGIDQTHSQAVP